MATQVPDVAEFDGEVVARLPLHIEGVVVGVGKLVGLVVDSQGDGLAICIDDGTGIGQQIRGPEALGLLGGASGTVP